MNKYIFLTTNFLILSFNQLLAICVEDLRQLNIPIVIVKTLNNEIPTCEYAFAPEGQNGVTSINQTKVKSRIFIIVGQDTLYNSGEYVDNVSGAIIRIRGNTSAYYSLMKPYKIKLQQKEDLLFRSDDNYKDKEWLLLNDQTLNLFVSNKVSEYMGIEWFPKHEFVNFFLNDDYQGLYILSESIKRSPECRINVDKKEGYIFEYDPYWWSEKTYVTTNTIGIKYRYTFKYPDEDDVTTEQIEEMTSLMNKVELSVMDGTYPEQINVESFARWLLIHDILGTKDRGGSNIYLTKYNKESMIKMCCPWDFSSIMWYNNYSSYSEGWAPIHSMTHWIYPYLWNSTNNEFINEYIKIWRNKSDECFQRINDYLMALNNSSEKKDIEESLKYTKERWYGITSDKDCSLDTEIKGMQEWFVGRKKWLNAQIEEISTGIEMIRDNANNKDTNIYNIYGIKHKYISNDMIYIKKGKKVVKEPYRYSH